VKTAAFLLLIHTYQAYPKPGNLRPAIPIGDIPVFKEMPQLQQVCPHTLIRAFGKGSHPVSDGRPQGSEGACAGQGNQGQY